MSGLRSRSSGFGLRKRRTTTSSSIGLPPGVPRRPGAASRRDVRVLTRSPARHRPPEPVVVFGTFIRQKRAGTSAASVATRSGPRASGSVRQWQPRPRHSRRGRGGAACAPRGRRCRAASARAPWRCPATPPPAWPETRIARPNRDRSTPPRDPATPIVPRTNERFAELGRRQQEASRGLAVHARVEQVSLRVAVPADRDGAFIHKRCVSAAESSLWFPFQFAPGDRDLPVLHVSPGAPPLRLAKTEAGLLLQLEEKRVGLR